MRNKEFELQKAVCQYIREKYPDVIYNSDLSGIRLPIGVAKQLKMLRSWRGFPDIVIYEPVKIEKQIYCGMFLELKVENTKLYKRDGSCSEHIKEQAEMLKALLVRGYWADFAIGYDDAIRKIEYYLNFKK